MKEKTKLRVIQILCIVSLLITVFSVQKTYAKYYEKIDTTYDANIKRWIINVNEKDIHNETTLSNVMTPQFFYDSNMTTNGNLNNILVPGRVGYFDFLIDYTKVDLAFRYQFNIEQLNTTELTDFEVYGYAIVDKDLEITSTTTISDITGVTTLTKGEDGKYDLSGLTQYMDPETDESKQKRILVLFRWYDGADNTMNNASDTAYVGEANTAEGADTLHKLLNYNIKITFTQKL